jgi:hypothetical protein
MISKKVDNILARVEVVVLEFETLFEDWKKLSPEERRIRQGRADKLFERQFELLLEWEREMGGR